jgi:crossover junction endodeoxyribonuclease RuvC
VIVGIDPGAQGAIAWMTDDGHLVEVADLPTVQEVVSGKKRTRFVPELFADMLACEGRRPVHAFLEQVNAMPGGGERKMGATSAFTFGMGAGLLRGVLVGMGIGHTLVPPATWKRDLGLKKDKDAARARACQLWPGAAGNFARVKDDGRAEAALIALHGSGRLHGYGKAAA